MESTSTLRRLAAFTRDPQGGNPAGVWLGDELPDPSDMQRIAAEVGYSETAFVAPAHGRDRTIRYYSTEAEVSFCGHATIATGVVLGETEGPGTYQLETAVGVVPVDVEREEGAWRASLVSVTPRHEAAGPSLVTPVLDALGWSSADLHEEIGRVRAFAGAWHLVLAVRDRDRLSRLDYDFDALKQIMLADDLTTVALIWIESPQVIHARDPFPVGGVVEDPATGAAAAALGGYLRDSGLLAAPTEFLIRQGEDMGRPSRLHVHLPVEGGIRVSGTAVPIE